MASQESKASGVPPSGKIEVAQRKMHSYMIIAVLNAYCLRPLMFARGTPIAKIAKIKGPQIFRSTVVPVLRGHPFCQTKVALKGRWSLIAG